MRRLAVGVEYDGGPYSGWQVQSTARSVQALLEAALSRIADHPVETTCAGRTDAGVHARAQVAHFDTEAVRPRRAWLLGTNNYLPDDISLRWVRPAPDHFHARYSARSRTYRYLILNRSARSALAAGRALLVHQPGVHGDPEMIPVVGALVNGIAHAIGHRFTELPVTPQKIQEVLA